jgi:hypothetical protein
MFVDEMKEHEAVSSVVVQRKGNEETKSSMKSQWKTINQGAEGWHGKEMLLPLVRHQQQDFGVTKGGK